MNTTIPLEPLRTKPLPEAYLGSCVMGEEEIQLLTEVVHKQSPFREYGSQQPRMVRNFEKEARQYFGVPHALATATGSGSFSCALAGLGIGPGDEVVIPAYAWFTDFTAPVLAGATPVFADIDRTLCMDPDDFERKITSNTKAVIVIHFQGACGQLNRILQIAKSKNINVIEDCAQACGATYQNKKLGSYGDVACFSFQLNKIMTTGDGGLLLAKNADVFERAARYHDLGQIRPSLQAQLNDEPQQHHFAGTQFRMNELTGAVALAQLRKLDRDVLAVTRQYHQSLKQRLRGACPDINFRQTGDDLGDAGIALYFDLTTPNRAEQFEKHLEIQGIRVGPMSVCRNLLHEPMIQQRRMPHPALPPFGPGCPGEHTHYTANTCPNTDAIIQSIKCVALGPSMTTDNIDDIATATIRAWHTLNTEA